MPDHMPDDWFRPRGDEARSDAPGDPSRPEPGEPAHRAQPGEAPEPQVEDTPEVEVTAERYTTQFKPGHEWARPRVSESRPSPTPTPVPSSVPTPEPAPIRSEPPERHRAEHVRTSLVGRHPVAVTSIAVLLSLGVGLAGGQLLRERTRGVDPSGSSGISSSTGPSTAGPSTSGRASSSEPTVVPPWSGATAPLQPATVSASCTADDATDAEGKPVSYPASHVIDADPATAWRCDGDGLGQSLSFTFPGGSVLVGVGLQNGYVKTSGETQLYDEYRKITRVRWTMADGSWFSQSLSDNNPSLQQVLIPPIEVKGPVTVTIEASTQAGLAGEPTRDAVLLSTVAFSTRA